MKRKELLKELKALSVEDLRKRSVSISEELMKLRFRKATNQLEEAHRLGILRRQRALVETLITQNRKGIKSGKAA